jgi:hypothetical protein
MVCGATARRASPRDRAACLNIGRRPRRCQGRRVALPDRVIVDARELSWQSRTTRLLVTVPAMARLIALAVVAAAVTAVSSATAAPIRMHAATRCRGAQLVGRFAVVPGSAGAGNITYALTLRNTSSAACTVTGLPQGTLENRLHRALPTHVRAAFPGVSAILVRLAPGRSTRATARFSPDVPGTGEQSTGRCEPVAWWFRVAAQGGGGVTVRVSPPTSVCEHGRLFFSVYRRL